ncbi:MAG TPA: hypothetical protein VLX28_01610, partial [Thermoanaerobaculia bacterium]|nr:hypothetical protein [Thermoanaerobaculia bacterium]
MTDLEVAERALRNPPFSPAESREHRWWVERYGLADQTRALVVGVDPKNLAEAGWGVLFSPGVTPEMREALEPLLKL